MNTWMKALLGPLHSSATTPGREAWPRARPFLLAGLIALLLLPVVGTVDWGEAAVAVGLAAVAAAVALFVPGVARRVTPDVGAIAALFILAILRNSVGGAGGGYGGLFLLPVLFVALYGTQVQLVRVLVAMAVVLFAPMLLIGAPQYPASGWRSGPLTLIVAGLVGFVVQELLQRERGHAAERVGLLAAIGDGVIVTDAHGRVIEVNDALCEIIGYEKEALIGCLPPLPSWPPGSEERLTGALSKAIREGRGEIETPLVRRDGRTISAQIVVAVSTSGGRRTVVATIKDATEQVQLREQLRSERNRSQAIVQSMHEGFGLTRDGQIIEVNDALCHITGFERDELVGRRPPFPFWPPEHEAEISDLLRHIGVDRGGSFEVTFMRADGTRFAAEVTAAPVTDAGGAPAGFVNSVRDITERKRAERAAEERTDQLRELASITRAVAHADPADARRTVCEMAIRVGDASAATLWEADDEGILHNTCMVGGEAPDFSLGPDAVQSGARRAFDARRAVFAGDPDTHMDPRMQALLKCGSAHFQPIFDGDEVIGVLAIAWDEPLPGLDDRRSHVVALLAHEAAVAIGKASAHAELEQMAHTDALTGLANRRAFAEQFPRAVAGARRARQRVSLAMIDLDHFKAFNDRHGHPAGDRLLRTATRSWSERLRATDVLVRWGGEEFCLLLPDCSPERASALLAELRALTPEGQSFSAGVAEWQPGLSQRRLVERADAALYEAKRRGRARTVTAGDELAADAA
jgi:diguanylate cyclase (GGDEF)-like protein/PAS domain S-box-containing protein